MTIAVNLIAVSILALLAWIFVRDFDPAARDADPGPGRPGGEHR